MKTRQDRDADIIAAPEAFRQRFWARVSRQQDGCWLFQPPCVTGYGVIGFDNRPQGTHRISLLWAKPRIETGRLHACHTCKNKNCVNPNHLYWGTAADNALDTRRANPLWMLRSTGSKSPNAKLNEESVAMILRDYIHEKHTAKTLAIKYSVPHPTISAILAGNAWRHVPRDKTGMRRASERNIFKGGDRCPNSKLTSRHVIAIVSRINSGEKRKDVAKAYDVSCATIDLICSGTIWASAWGVGAGKRPPAAAVRSDERRSREDDAIKRLPQAALARFVSGLKKDADCWAAVPLHVPPRVSPQRLMLTMHRPNRCPSKFEAVQRCPTIGCVRPLHLFWRIPSLPSDDCAKGTRPKHAGQRHAQSLLSDEQVLLAWKMWAKGGISARAIGETLGVGGHIINMIMTRKSYASVTRHLPNIERAGLVGGAKRGAASPCAVLNAKQVLKIRELYSSGHGHTELAEQFGVSRHNIWSIVARRSWKHI